MYKYKLEYNGCPYILFKNKTRCKTRGRENKENTAKKLIVTC